MSLQSEFARIALDGGRAALVTVLDGAASGSKLLVRADGATSGSLLSGWRIQCGPPAKASCR